MASESENQTPPPPVASSTAMSPGGSSGDGAAMQTLATMVERAEKLEQEGRYREAAEMAAQAMTEAHTDYVRCQVASTHFQSQHLLQLPSMPQLPMPRRSYIERYKARLRVDWQKWDRVSRRGLYTQADGTGDSDDEGTDDGTMAPSGAESSLGVSLSATRAGPSNSVGSNSDENPDEWKPETLDTLEDSTGHIELIHTMCNGDKITVVSIARLDLPKKAVYLFNREAKQTMKKLLHGDAELCGSRTYTHAELARWLLTASKLSKNKIGDYLGRSDEDAIKILRAFLDELDFAPFAFDEALRFFLSTFRLPGEAQQIDRIVQNFAERYHSVHPGVFSTADTAYVLAFSVIMLNTDAHSPQIEHKMTLDQFLRNNQGIDDGRNLPDELLAELYRSIVAHEIRMEQREYIAADKEGWLLKQGGRWKSWKRRYTILSGNVLYYFKKTNDGTPAGFVPLEGIEVHGVPAKLVFELRPAKTAAGDEPAVMKSARMDPNGKSTFQQGNHSVFRFKVEGGVEHLDAWVRAVREHSVARQVRTTANGKDVDAKRAGMSFFRGKAKPGAKPGHRPAAMPPTIGEITQIDRKASNLHEASLQSPSGSSVQFSSTLSMSTPSPRS